MSLALRSRKVPRKRECGGPQGEEGGQWEERLGDVLGREPRTSNIVKKRWFGHSQIWGNTEAHREKDIALKMKGVAYGECREANFPFQKKKKKNL